MSKIIKVAGRAKVANLDGMRIERPEVLFVRSENGWFRTIDTYAHFCYKQTWHPGSTLMCTCGSPAGIFRYDAYMKYYSVNRGAIVACVNHMQYGRHADGSTE